MPFPGHDPSLSDDRNISHPDKPVPRIELAFPFARIAQPILLSISGVRTTPGSSIVISGVPPFF